MEESGADVKGGGKGGTEQIGADPAAAELSPVPQTPHAPEVEDLISSAVRRIASAITPIPVLTPDPLQHAIGTPPGPSSAADTRPDAPKRDQVSEEQVTSAPQLVRAETQPAAEHAVSQLLPLEPAVEDHPPEDATTEPDEPITPSPGTGTGSPPPPDRIASPNDPLAYVPSDGDRIAPPPSGNAATPRIEPTFDSPLTASPLTAEPLLTNDDGAAASARAPDTLTGAPAAGRLRTRIFDGAWTWRRIARLAGLALAAYFATVLVLILAYRLINPPTTTLIAYQWATGTTIQQDWQPIENISPNLLRAVVVSEDWGFCDHYGVDIDALEKALELAGEGKIARGASTISMQVIKNLFLTQSKSFLRKAVEIPLTVVAETVWPKSRMLEIYLNIAEWGPGIFGAEAAARHHFNKPASRLTEREAALLAAALPNPILRDAGDPSTRTARKASVIQTRMRAAGPVANCAMTTRQRSTEDGSNQPPKSGPGWQTTVKKRAGTDPGL